ncbi:sugar ABC transporter ATP-binding protein [Ilumatobacter nonamiensis]|uniref:sugar ABC transporter ATP-binding protein n=1 Tax=Ilumatobacter nonamiensis TaxID=467093 RepID=UPI000346B53C|nr:sugar ABC transporter ATP-binding protein [Ilumatobacter nonamiensis]
MSKLLVVRDLTKSFPGQVALDEFDIEIEAGRTHALVGQNGSGKSTFIKILAGYHEPDPGSSARLAGHDLRLGDGEAAKDAGVRFVHQDLGLVDTLNAVENISMGVGYTTGRFGRINWQADRRRAVDGLAALGFTDVPVDVPIAALAPSEKTAVALARALDGWEDNAHLLVLDEPTASLPGADVERLFRAIRLLKERGVAILYVSHHLDEVFEIADDVTVLRDGVRVTTESTSDLDHERLIELMIGHRLEHVDHRSVARVGETAGLAVESIRGGTIADLDLVVQPGEVVGVAGITGSGRELVAPFITGQAPSESGNVVVCGTSIPNYDPHAAISAGMAFVPADRATHGIIPLESVTHNLTLADVDRNWRGGRLRHRDERAECLEWIDRLQIKTAGTGVPIAALSGGNQQKVLFGRSLRLTPSVLVLDEPTSGIDVKAKDQILQLIDQAAGDGAAVLVVSTDTDELVQAAHRILIMVGGTIVAELSGADMTTENVERAQLQSTKATTS